MTTNIKKARDSTPGISLSLVPQEANVYSNDFDLTGDLNSSHTGLSATTEALNLFLASPWTPLNLGLPTQNIATSFNPFDGNFNDEISIQSNSSLNDIGKTLSPSMVPLRQSIPTPPSTANSPQLNHLINMSNDSSKNSLQIGPFSVIENAQYSNFPDNNTLYQSKTAHPDGYSLDLSYAPTYSYYSQNKQSARYSPGPSASLIGSAYDLNTAEDHFSRPPHLPAPEAPTYDDYEDFDEEALQELSRNDPGFSSYEEYQEYLANNSEYYNNLNSGANDTNLYEQTNGRKHKRSYQCSLPGCGKIYTTTAGLRYHLRHVHDFKSIPRHTATIAAATAALNAAHFNAAFQRQPKPEVETKEIYTIPGTNKRVRPPYYQCKECTKRYSTAAGLRYHKKTFNHTVGCGGAVGKAAAEVGREWLNSLQQGTVPTVTFSALE